MQWFAQAPANIALIKYMGKKDREKNIPDNPSLSYTLNNLLTHVMLESHAGPEDRWEPLTMHEIPKINLSKAAQNRFLKHLSLLKSTFDYSGSFIVRSNNTFPHSSGLASSASSFAALTKCALLAISELQHRPLPSIETQANLSRLGSGSSCRSFFSPWAIWDEEQVKGVELPYNELLHEVIVISQEEKKVSSSEAHLRISSSPQYKDRGQRAHKNLDLLMMALQNKNWPDAYQICWREFQDMHDLFSSCTDSFSYFTDQTHEVLKQLKDLWQREGDGPIVTMDAGPNIHLLYRPDQAELARRFNQNYLVGNYNVI